MEAGGDVDGQHRRVGPIDRLHRLGPGTFQGPFQTGAENGIHDDPGTGRQGPIGLAMPSRIPVGGEGVGGIPRQPTRVGELEYRDGETLGTGEPGHHIAVAPVVPRPGEHRQVAVSRPARPQQAIGGSPGPLHQLDPGDTVDLDRGPVQGAHLRRPIEGMGQVGRFGQGSH